MAISIKVVSPWKYFVAVSKDNNEKRGTITVLQRTDAGRNGITALTLGCPFFQYGANPNGLGNNFRAATSLEDGIAEAKKWASENQIVLIDEVVLVFMSVPYHDIDCRCIKCRG